MNTNLTPILSSTSLSGLRRKCTIADRKRNAAATAPILDTAGRQIKAGDQIEWNNGALTFSETVKADQHGVLFVSWAFNQPLTIRRILLPITITAAA